MLQKRVEQRPHATASAIRSSLNIALAWMISRSSKVQSTVSLSNAIGIPSAQALEVGKEDGSDMQLNGSRAVTAPEGSVGREMP